MRAPCLTLALALVLGCSAARSPDPQEASPGFVFPAEFAEGKGEPEGERGGPPAAPTSTPSNAPAQSPPPAQPDPEPLRLAEQYEYELLLERGQIRVERVRAVTLPQPIVTARRMGRYAIELFIGPELVERVRFDFPLTAADEPEASGPKPLNAPPNLGSGVTASQKVWVPQSPRARRARLLDRATGKAIELPWPPDRSPLGTADAGAPSEAGAP